VSTVKAALRKYVEEYEPHDWDLHLPWLLMGYRFSTQHSLGVVSPYEMLYGKRALLPLKGSSPPFCGAPRCPETGTHSSMGRGPAAEGGAVLADAPSSQGAPAGSTGQGQAATLQSHPRQFRGTLATPPRPGGGLCLPAAPTPRHLRDGQGAANPAGASDHQLRRGGATVCSTACSASENTRGMSPHAHSCEWSPSRSICSSAEAAATKRGGGEVGPLGVTGKEPGKVFSSRRAPHRPLPLQGAVVGNGHKG